MNKLNTYKQYLLPTLSDENIWGDEIGRRGLSEKSTVKEVADAGANYQITISTESEHFGEAPDISKHLIPKKDVEEVVKALEEASKQPPHDFSRPDDDWLR